MTIYQIITSRKIEDQLLKLHYEIEELKDELRSGQESERWLNNWQAEHVANLQSNLQQPIPYAPTGLSAWLMSARTCLRRVESG